jgi:hypothetical protein
MAVKRLFRLKVQAGPIEYTLDVTETDVVASTWDHFTLVYGPTYTEGFATLTEAMGNVGQGFKNIYGRSEFRRELATKIDTLEQETFEPGADVETLQTTIDRLINVYNS